MRTLAGPSPIAGRDPSIQLDAAAPQVSSLSLCALAGGLVGILARGAVGKLKVYQPAVC